MVYLLLKDNVFYLDKKEVVATNAANINWDQHAFFKCMISFAS